MRRIYTCYGCGQQTEVENKAKECCSNWVEGKGGEKIIPKQFRNHIDKTILHICNNMYVNGKQWQCELEEDEVCPECGFQWYPR